MIIKSEFTQTNGGVSINTRIHSMTADLARAFIYFLLGLGSLFDTTKITREPNTQIRIIFVCKETHCVILDFRDGTGRS